MTPADVVLETHRLVLRRFTDTDADAALLFGLDSDPEVMRYVGPYTLPSVEAYREHIRTRFLPLYAHPQRGVFAAHLKPAGEFVGWFIFRPAPEYRFAAAAGWDRPSDVELGYRLRKAAWGRGLATEGSRALVALGDADPDVTGIVAAAVEANRGSVRVLGKCGLVRYGSFRLPEFADPVLQFARWRPGCDTPG